MRESSKHNIIYCVASGAGGADMIKVRNNEARVEELLEELIAALGTMQKYLRNPKIQEAGKDMDVPPKCALNWLGRLSRSAKALEVE